MSKYPLLGMTLDELQSVVRGLGMPKFAAKQIASWLYDKKVNSIVDFMVLQIPGFILNSSERYKYLAYRLKKMLISAINIISMQIKQGNFEPVDYEVSFRKNARLFV